MSLLHIFSIIFSLLCRHSSIFDESKPFFSVLFFSYLNGLD